jgi:hypothetical protein
MSMMRSHWSTSFCRTNRYRRRRSTRKGKPVPRAFYELSLQIEFVENSVNEARIRASTDRPQLKRCNRFRQRLPPRSHAIVHDAWSSAVSRKFLKPLVTPDGTAVCKALQTDGMGLLQVLRLLSGHPNYEEAGSLRAHALGVLLESRLFMLLLFD